MTDSPRAVAFVGVAGGAGTTRLVVETAAVLARDGRDVAVFDAAFATQGLAQYVPGRIDVDATRLVTDDAVAPSDAFVDLAPTLALDHPDDGAGDDGVDDAGDDAGNDTGNGAGDGAGDGSTGGRVAVCPASASFTGFAAAKTTDAAERFQTLIRETASAFDAVLVDVPPLAANQHVAAVTAADRIAYVAPSTERGANALPRVQDCVRDVDASSPEDVVVASRPRTGDDASVPDADVRVPESDVTRPDDAPVCDATTGAFPRAVRDVAETAFDVDVDLALEPRSVTDRVLGRQPTR